jgi:dihydrofolate synthase/folylpolyglutamate synthase
MIVNGGCMNYNEAIEYIHSTHKYGWKLGLANITRLLELMGNPHQKLKYIHIAGTNGKGSTAAFISSILIEAGYRVGIFTSPYLERFTERMKVNKLEISEEELSRITEFVKRKVDIMLERGDSHPTEFEIVTAIAFQYFNDNDCDIVVLEVGLGGRFDSTNVIDTPLVSIITSISYDHMNILGNSLKKIAFEKAGIIKPGGDVVIAPQAVEIERVLENICSERKAKLHKVDFSSIKYMDFNDSEQVFHYNNYEFLRVSLLGDHQIKNAVIAIETCKVIRNRGFVITEKYIRKGLINAKWPGRLEILRRQPVFLIDGAHNTEGIKAFCDALIKYFPNSRKIFIVGVLRDKDYKSMLELVIPFSDMFITITPDNDRALPAKDLAIFISAYCKNVLISDTIEDAIKTSLQTADSCDVVCAFGSLYFVGEVRKCFMD